jgi:hypothetical protein
MSIVQCCFCEVTIDTDFVDCMTITVCQHATTVTGEHSNLKVSTESIHHFCGECKDPDEVSQLLTDLNIDHTIE